MLQGTFETLSLTEVLGLLAAGRKTGALWLEAESVQGRVYLVDGRCCAAESGEVTGPVGSDSELSTRLVDVCFTLARHPGGSFRFVIDEVPSWPAPSSVPVDDAVGSLERLLNEWRDIQAVIPTLEARPRLAPDLLVDSIILDAARWRLVVALDGRRSVRDVMHETERSVLDVCNALKDLIEEGAVELAPPISETVLDNALGPYTTQSNAAPDGAVPAEFPPEVSAEAAPTADDEGAFVDSGAAAPAPVEPFEAAEAMAAAADNMPDPFAGVDEFAEAGDMPAFGEEAPVPEAEAAFAPEVFDASPAPEAFDAPSAPETYEPVSPVESYDASEATAPAMAAVASDGGGAVPPPAALDETDPRDRGALLRLFSALRDT